MVIRIRMKHGPAIERPAHQYRPAGTPGAKDSNRISLEEMAGGLAELLTPATVIAAVLGVWRLGADMHMAGPFFIEDGIWSHYQTWFAIAGLLQLNVAYLRKKAARASVPQS